MNHIHHTIHTAKLAYIPLIDKWISCHIRSIVFFSHLIPSSYATVKPLRMHHIMITVACQQLSCCLCNASYTA